MTLSGGAESVDFGHRCNGCASSHGCHAVARCSGSSCHGCHGGLFSRHGNRCHHACHGGGHCASSCHAVSVGCHGCHGGSGYSSCCGGMIGGPRAMVYGPAPATIVVTLPANAQLLVDNQPTTSTTARRMFQTPTLQPGTDYFYTLQANVERDGRTINMQKQVTVRAGQESRVAFELPSAEVGAAGAQPRIEGAREGPAVIGNR